MTIDEVGETKYLTIFAPAPGPPRAAPTERRYQVYLLRGESPVPLGFAFFCSPESALSDLTERVCAKWNLPPADIVFGLRHSESDVKTIVASATKLAELDLEGNEIVVGLPDQFASQGLGMIPAPAPRLSARRSVVLSAGQIVIQFREFGTDRSFTRTLSKSATIMEAKEEVAAFLGAPSGECITLLLDGRPLQSGLVRSRIRGNAEVTVAVRNHEVVVLTASSGGFVSE
jgi:hypothetical protein